MEGKKKKKKERSLKEGRKGVANTKERDRGWTLVVGGWW